MTSNDYQRPGLFTRTIFNRTVSVATRAGLSIWGSRILEVRGRKTGQLRQNPVNVLHHGEHRYLVAPRGQTEWVRNLRAAGEGSLRLGKRVERVRAIELGDTEKPDILRAYLRRWKMEVGMFFKGVDSNSPTEDLLRVASEHPVFRLETPVDHRL
jgi:deazaflavin-dependent oxidoreductase (nitroreductase family)